MNKSISRVGLLFFLFLLVVSLKPIYSQALEDSISVENVLSDPPNSEKKIVIHYDLIGPKNLEYKIILYLKSASDAAFLYKPRVLSGDVGKGFFAGKDKKIVWDITKEFPLGIAEKDYYVEVVPEPIIQKKPLVTKSDKEMEVEGTGSNLLYYIGGGVVVGAAAILLLSGGKTESSTGGSFPKPPVFPQ